MKKMNTKPITPSITAKITDEMAANNVKFPEGDGANVGEAEGVGEGRIVGDCEGDRD
jgi:hypothetical protein